MATGEDLRRVGRAVAARRGELGMTQQGLADTAGVDIKTIYNLESGTRWPIAKTRAAVSAALQWEGDTLAVIAEGPAPEPFTLERAGESFLVSREFAAEMAPHVSEVEGRLAKWAGTVVQQRGASALGEIPDGETLFRDRPQDARTWDALIRQGYLGERFTLWQLVQAIAIERVHEQERRQGHRDRGDAAAGLMHR